MKYTCPYCDSAFLQFIESEEQLRDHMLKAHGRELSSQANRWEKCLFGAKRTGKDSQPELYLSFREYSFQMGSLPNRHGLCQSRSKAAYDPCFQTCPGSRG